MQVEIDGGVATEDEEAVIAHGRLSFPDPGPRFALGVADGTDRSGAPESE
jgi:hypothetical protein